MIKKYMGESCILLCCIFLSFSTLLSHHLVNNFNPILITFYSFTFAFIFIQLIWLKKENLSVNKLLKGWKMLLLLNFSTAIDWILMFIALKYISGSIVNCFIFGVAPLATLLISLKSYSSRKYLFKDLIVTLLITLILFSLATLYYHAIDPNFPKEKILLGILLSTISGIATALTVICSKKLYQQGLTSLVIMKIRYILLLLFCFGIILYFKLPLYISFNQASYLLLLALFFVVLPAFLFQKGIEKSSPVSVVIISSLTPLITYFMQLFEPQASFNIKEFCLILSLTLLICIATVMKPNEI